MVTLLSTPCPPKYCGVIHSLGRNYGTAETDAREPTISAAIQRRHRLFQEFAPPLASGGPGSANPPGVEPQPHRGVERQGRTARRAGPFAHGATKTASRPARA